MPISLGPPTTNPKWRGCILTLLWLAQLLIAVTLFFASLAMVLVIGGTGAHKEIPWYLYVLTFPHLISSPSFSFLPLTFPSLNPSFTTTTFQFYRMEKKEAKKTQLKCANIFQNHHNNIFLSRQYRPPLNNPLRTNLHMRRTRLPLRLTLLPPPTRQIAVLLTTGHSGVC